MSKKTKPPAISDAATQYALEVVSGKRVAGPHVRGQCARHLRDIEDGHKRGLVWNVAESEKAQGFYADVLKLNGGDYEGKPFELLPWQKFVVGSLFGWQGADGSGASAWLTSKPRRVPASPPWLPVSA